MSVSSMQVPLTTAKNWAKKLKDNSDVSLSQCQQSLAVMLGFKDWHALNQELSIPIDTPVLLDATLLQNNAPLEVWFILLMGECLVSHVLPASFYPSKSRRRQIQKNALHAKKSHT